MPGWGCITAVWEEGKLLNLSFTGGTPLAPPEAPLSLPEDRREEFLVEVERQVGAYLRGELHRLELPYVLPAQPAFCRKLWLEALAIPYGQVISYGSLAARAGNPLAARAAGYAMSINQLFLIVPCHRVIASGGKLGGYGGRPDLKARLLTLEGLRVEEGRVL